MPDLREEQVSLDRLLLDPNNYRFQDDPSYVSADEGRFAEPSVQDRAYRRLRGNSLLALKNSIITNGFLTFERLVVRPYTESGQFIVVEGNRRTAALKWIEEDHDSGVEIPQAVLDSLAAIPVIVIEDTQDPALRLSLMGVRHVAGINEWGGYQRAKLVTELRDEFSLDTSEVASRLGMTPHEVNRRYRAFKALHQMETDEEFGDRAEATMYPIFHEAVSLPIVRQWLGWSDDEALFTNENALRQFYELIAPVEDEDGVLPEPKITTYSQIRELRSILEIPEAKRLLLDPSRSFHEAVGTAKAEQLAGSWATEIAEAVAALKSVGALELARLSADDIGEIEKLRDLAQELLDTYAKVVS